MRSDVQETGWRFANDPSAHDDIVRIGTHWLIAMCAGLNIQTGYLEVDRCEACPGKHPLPVLGADAEGPVSDVLALPFTVTRGDRTAADVFLYWDGEGWLNDKSEPTDGPLVRLIR